MHKIAAVSYTVFARKYRPATFDDVLGQDHVVQTLKNAITQNRLAHAYLFVGPRGTGKTSTSRIFAKALNCPGGPKVDFDPNDPVCKQIAEGNSLDVIEIDGASNNGVDDVRAMRDAINFPPMSGAFKIYYIDEVHMLTTNAFNALLKTLEEPPPYAKFIFATTEVHKILPTILSRCQRFDLRPIPTDTIAKHLLHISEKEGINLEETAAWAIAKGADGGMRDAQSMLDQLVSFCGNHISEKNVLDVFGFTSRDTIAALCQALFERNTTDSLKIIQRENDAGRDLSQLLNELISAMRAILVAKVDANSTNEGIPLDLWDKLMSASASYKPDRLLALMDVFAETDARMKWASNRKLHLELGLIKAIQTLGEVRISDIITTLTNAAPTLSQNQIAEPASAPVREKSEPIVEKSEALQEAPPEPPAKVETPARAEVKKEFAKSPKAQSDGFDLHHMMADAPDEAPEPPTPPPAPVEAPVEEKKEIPAPKAADDFHNDPLIKKALEIFAATLRTA